MPYTNTNHPAARSPRQVFNVISGSFNNLAATENNMRNWFNSVRYLDDDDRQQFQWCLQQLSSELQTQDSLLTEMSNVLTTSECRATQTWNAKNKLEQTLSKERKELADARAKQLEILESSKANQLMVPHAASTKMLQQQDVNVTSLVELLKFRSMVTKLIDDMVQQKVVTVEQANLVVRPTIGMQQSQHNIRQVSGNNNQNFPSNCYVGNDARVVDLQALTNVWTIDDE